MGFFEKDLRVKITAILCLLVLLALVASLVTSYFFMNRIISDNINENMLDSARMVVNMLSVSLERREQRITLAASSDILRSRDRNTALVTELLNVELVITWPIGREAVLVDTNGNVICGTGLMAALGNATGTTWFRNAQKGRIELTYIYDPKELTGSFFDSPVLAVSSPVRDEKDQINSYVVAFTAMSDILKAVDSVRIGESGHAFLVDGSGSVIAGNLFGPRMDPSEEEQLEIERLTYEMTSGLEGSSTISYNDNDYLVTYTPVRQASSAFDVDWSVGVVVPTSEAYAPARDAAWILVGLTAILLAVSVLAAIILGRSITNPINELASSAERIGSGDLTGEVAIRTRDQIGTLAAAFLRMRDYLRSTLGEAGYSSDKMVVLAEEQSAATRDVFNDIEEIVDSVIVLAKNTESQTEKIRKILEYFEQMPEEARKNIHEYRRIVELLQQSEILAEVGANKAVEIASASQDQRGAARDVAAAARRLSDMAAELREMVNRFKV